MTTTAPLQSKANPSQLQAIHATDGPVLIIAGPGSGKTFSLVERIIYLLADEPASAPVGDVTAELVGFMATPRWRQQT